MLAVLDDRWRTTREIADLVGFEGSRDAQRITRARSALTHLERQGYAESKIEVAERRACGRAEMRFWRAGRRPEPTLDEVTLSRLSEDEWKSAYELTGSGPHTGPYARALKALRRLQEQGLIEGRVRARPKVSRHQDKPHGPMPTEWRRLP